MTFQDKCKHEYSHLVFIHRTPYKTQIGCVKCNEWLND